MTSRSRRVVKKVEKKIIRPPLIKPGKPGAGKVPVVQVEIIRPPLEKKDDGFIIKTIIRPPL